MKDRLASYAGVGKNGAQLTAAACGGATSSAAPSSSSAPAASSSSAAATGSAGSAAGSGDGSGSAAGSNAVATNTGSNAPTHGGGETGSNPSVQPAGKSDQLEVTTTPAGARVFLDGAEIGKTPLKLIVFYAGAVDKQPLSVPRPDAQTKVEERPLFSQRDIAGPRRVSLAELGITPAEPGYAANVEAVKTHAPAPIAIDFGRNGTKSPSGSSSVSACATDGAAAMPATSARVAMNSHLSDLSFRAIIRVPKGRKRSSREKARSYERSAVISRPVGQDTDLADRGSLRSQR